jgi:crotonobetainyl-CoA:carnitine CoA-transferase CaiB-like acyl-CoA transferase
MTLPCEDIRVIDLSGGRAGGIATMVLGDYGADVIKVEPPGGDPSRAEAAAPMFLRGKRSVTLDLDTPGGRQKMHDLVRGADVVVASYAAGEAEKHEADYATLSALNDKLVYCSVTAWGLKGPYAHYPQDEALVAGKSGRMLHFQNVTRREGPSWAAVQVGTHGASQAAVTGILAALHARDRTGKGQMVEASLLAGMIPFESNLVRHQMDERYPERMATEGGVRNTANGMSSLGYQPILAKDDRWIQFANLLEHLFQAQVVALGLTEEILLNPKYEGAPNRITEEAREEIRNIMLARVREKTADEWMDIFRQHENVAADYVGSAQEALYHPDLVANGEVVEQQHPKYGTIRMLGPVGKLRETPGRAGGPAPEPGADTEAVLAEAPRQLATPKGNSGDTKPPLDGITILEFATIIATPLACSMLGDLGARVIKVEPIGGDPGRGLARAGGLGSYVGATRTNASKESICIDLKSEHGQALVRELIKKADFIIHNYRPGVPDRLGIGYEQAKAIKPDIIWMNLGGYGPDGPSADRACAHPIPGAVNGGALMQAGIGWPPPGPYDIETIREASRQFTRANESNPDPCSAMGLQTSALLALRARDLTGKGQQVFQSMLNANQYANSDDAVSYQGKPERPTLDAKVMGIGPLRRLYTTKDGWITLSADTQAQFGALCEAAEREDLATDPRFKDAAARAQHSDELIAELEALFARDTADEWERCLIKAGVGCVRADSYVNSGKFFMEDAQVHANGLAPRATHVVWGDYQRWGPVVNFSTNPGRYGGGVVAGEHTDQLLAELGFDAEAAADLRARNVVWADDKVPSV